MLLSWREVAEGAEGSVGGAAAGRSMSLDFTVGEAQGKGLSKVKEEKMPRFTLWIPV